IGRVLRCRRVAPSPRRPVAERSDMGPQESLTQREGIADCGLEMLVDLRLDDQPVHDYFHLVVARLVQVQVFADIYRCSVDHQPTVALLPYLGEQEVQVFPVYFEDRGADLDGGARGKGEELLGDLRGGPDRDLLPAEGAVGDADRGEQQI